VQNFRGFLKVLNLWGSKKSQKTVPPAYLAVEICKICTIKNHCKVQKLKCTKFKGLLWDKDAFLALGSSCTFLQAFLGFYINLWNEKFRNTSSGHFFNA
jgi:hypothetical protein